MLDGTSNTLLLGENISIVYTPGSMWSSNWASGYRTQTSCSLPVNVGHTANPVNAPGGDGFWTFRSKHVGGCNFARVDGSVQFMSQNIDLAAYRSLGIRNDGLPIANPF